MYRKLKYNKVSLSQSISQVMILWLSHSVSEWVSEWLWVDCEVWVSRECRYQYQNHCVTDFTQTVRSLWLSVTIGLTNINRLVTVTVLLLLLLNTVSITLTCVMCVTTDHTYFLVWWWSWQWLCSIRKVLLQLWTNAMAKLMIWLWMCVNKTGRVLAKF